MKLTFLAVLIAVSLAACAKRSPGPEPVLPTDPATMAVPNSYGSKVHTLAMPDGNTCYVVTRDGFNSISCVRK